MSSLWSRTMLWLGLAPDEEYEGYEPRPSGSAPAPERQAPAEPAPVRPVEVAPEPEREPEPAPALSKVRPIREPEPEPPAPEPAPEPSLSAGEGTVRAIPVSSAKPHVVLPTSFNQAQELGDRFKGNQPVIMNLQNVERDLARRLIDFASGLCYGVGGQMERVAKDVYLLTPTDVEVSDEERRRLSERGLHDG